MLFVGTSIIHPSTEGVFLLCNILDLLIYRYQFLVGQYEKSFIKPVFHILDWGMSMGNYGMALEELGYFEKAIGVCRKRIQQTLFAGKGGSLHTSLMVEACILEAQKDVKCKKYFKQDLDLLRLYKMQTNYKLMESYVKTNKIFD